MATRNRSLVFIQYRNEKKSKRSPSGPRRGTTEQEKLVGGKASYEMEDLEEGKPKSSLSIPPGWMSIVDDINYDLSRITAEMNKLAECHKSHLLPQFEVDDRQEEEQTIEILTEKITKMYQQTQNKIQRMSQERVKKQEEEVVKKNIQSQLASQLQDLSLEFRKAQKDYLQRLKGKKDKGRTFQIEDDVDDDTNFDVTFTDRQKMALKGTEDVVTQREADILKIAKSINELAMIFKDLSTLVIEQGTILDRIDYNIEQVQHNTDQAIVDLTKASKTQKSYRNKLCMLLLCIAILIMIVAAIVRGLVPS